MGTATETPAKAPQTEGLLRGAKAALALFDTEGWEEAVALLREALDDAPADAACHAALAETYAYWGFRREVLGLEFADDYAMGLDHAKRAIHLGPERSDSHRALALALRRGENANPDRRREEILIALDLDAEDPANWHDYWRVRGYDPDDPCARKALELQPAGCGLLIDLGAALAERGRLDEALASFEGALAVNGRNALANFDLAMTLDRRGRTPEALRRLRAAAAERPDEPLLRWGLELLEGP